MYVAQEIPQIDAEIAQKGLFRMETISEGEQMVSSRLGFLILFILFFLVLLYGCSTTRANQANLALGQLILGNSKQAWNMISKELAKPTVSSQEDLCEVHIATLQILQSITNHDFAPANPDQIAKSSYEYLTGRCKADKKRMTIVENLYGLYFQNTKRPGFAISHYKRSLELSGEVSFEKTMNEHNLSVAYADMGLFELRDFHRLRAIQIGREYFNRSRIYKYSLDEAREWLEYKRILTLRIDDLSWSGGFQAALSEMKELWKEIEKISQKWASAPTRFVDYIYASQRFSSAGDTSFARKLLDEARKLTRKYPYKDPKVASLDLQSSEYKILEAEGKWKEAADLSEDWANRFEKISGITLDGNSLRLVGLTQESAERYGPAIDYLERAIGQFETRRSSFELKSRAQFLGGLMITPYWGLIRSYGYLYMKDKNEKDYQGALQAEHKLRARQFGELLGIEQKFKMGSDMTNLRLRKDELLLDIVLTDKALVIFSIATDWHDVSVIPCDAKAFNDSIMRIKSKLSNREDIDSLTSDILSLSKLLFSSMGDKLAKYKKLIVLTDGSLSGIPLSILSDSFTHYQPLIAEHEVVYTPSISYLAKQRNSKEESIENSLFAVADPAYASLSVPDAYKDDTASSFYTRAVRDFNLLAPLPETRTEVMNIGRLFGKDKVSFLLGSEATKSRLSSQYLDRYRYLHFATHGVLGNQIPGVYEPALVLAAGASFSDGFLTMSEVENFKLRSDLTVLSACDTGSGKYYTGEGVMGLSRSFLLAGSRSVLVSLWPIASETTVQFMERFYQYLMAGKSKSESLRLTQLEFMRGKYSRASAERSLKIIAKEEKNASLGSTVHPYFWAPFILIGE
jgi:CHAT domain-containing protein